MDYFSSDKIVTPAKGDLLISEPYLPDPNFERTVILLCEHSDEGTFGFVLNKKANVHLKDVVENTEKVDTELFMGGPVQQDTLHFIHRSKVLAPSSNRIVEKAYWGHDFDELIDALGMGLVAIGDVQFFLGYSGWSPGQLMDEMKTKSWIVFKNTTEEMIFDWDNQDLWEACLKSMGGKYRLISKYPKDPRMN